MSELYLAAQMFQNYIPPLTSLPKISVNMDNASGVMIMVTNKHHDERLRGPLHIHLFSPITLATMCQSYDMIFCLPSILLEDDSFDESSPHRPYNDKGSVDLRRNGIKVDVKRGIPIEEARLSHKDLVVLPRIIIEEGNLKEIVQCAMGLCLLLYTLTNRDAKHLLSSIATMKPSDVDPPSSLHIQDTEPSPNPFHRPSALTTITMTEGVVIAVQCHRQRVVQTEVVREITFDEAKTMCDHVFQVPKSLIEGHNLKELICTAATNRWAMYAATKDDADRLLSFIETLRPSDFDS
ncbi:hypothetical protein EDD15DRAFT_2190575 [Pisolithus albus]|nr:hypothetical protein EDD15DRAFT_2190575 [Pisolithus albus]